MSNFNNLLGIHFYSGFLYANLTYNHLQLMQLCSKIFSSHLLNIENYIH